ncbi:sensor histidine kinase [Helicobacter sp. 23-1048]
MSHNSTRKSIIQILSLYLGTSIILLCWLFYFFYKKEVRNIFLTQVASLREETLEINDILHKYKYDIDEALPEILQNKEHNIGIFKRDGTMLFSNLLKNPSDDEFAKGVYEVEDKVIIDPEFLPSPHKSKKRSKFRIFIQDSKVDSLIFASKVRLALIFVLVLGIMSIVAFVLVRLFLKPLNEHIQRLDDFIKDATHETNTPISIVLMSIETLKTHNLSEEERKKIGRIKLACLQLGHIYRELVAYNFPHSMQDKTSNLDLQSLLEERLDFFAPFFTQKKLSISLDSKPARIMASREKIVTLFDNLLSNAIKYNKKGGSIALRLDKGIFEISDEGFGIQSKDLPKIFERYSRFNPSSGGFGIGLSLVKRICDEYNIKIQVVSEPNKGATFKLSWES